ncbi:class I SAM-dependent methyltransferase [Limnochorda pilosa]|uniref:16S rRNA methyltransferase n=1 Tax=Limnochorda pilosa TaxID=1555112 RepID=A0A0K2SJ13_LIMPI|nr:methyltransferase [Limnochorda pilosa]BAS27080.1 16S rRNA methyltransferase [Limnochorda pilosa]
MDEHYYTEEPQAPHDRRLIELNLGGERYRFWTDRGVFSRARVDRGTRLVLEGIEPPAAGAFLDVGAGYGVLGIVLARRRPEARVDLVELNRRAAALARENLALNGVSNARVLEGNGFEPVSGRVYDLVVSNPPLRAGRDLVRRWIDQAFDHLSPGGRLYLVARTHQGAASLEKLVARRFGSVVEAAKGGGFRLFYGERPASRDGS